MSESQQINKLTLQERLKKADYLVRELNEHLKQAYLPKLGALRSASKIYDPEEVSDQQIFDRTMDVLNAEEFADDLYVRLHAYLDSIADEMRGMFFNPETEKSESSANTPVFDINDFIE